MPEDNTKELVKQKFTQYLEVKKLRKTPERFAVLEKIYSMNVHFDVCSLYEIMTQCEYRVSKATIYNTIGLLVDAGLVRQHQFGNNPLQYEKAFNTANHHHLICTQCGRIREVKDLDLLSILNNKKFNNFVTSYYSLYVYGICSRCMKAEKKKNIHNQK